MSETPSPKPESTVTPPPEAPEAPETSKTPETSKASGASRPPTSSEPPTPEPHAYVPERGGVVGQIAMVVVVLVLCAAGAWWWSHHEAEKKVAPAHTGDHPPQEVNTFTVVQTDAPIVLEYLGQTAFSQRVDIRARVKGFLETRSFEEGGRVRKGQVLFTIEQATFVAALDAAKARLAQAEARYAQAQREVARFSELLAQNAASQRELDDWKTNVEVYAADIQAAKANIQQAQLDLDYTVIRSPIDGVISQTFQDVGNYVGDGADESLLATVGQDQPIYVEFPVSEQDLLRWRSFSASATLEQAAQSDLQVQLMLSNGQEYPSLGRLDFVDTRVAPATGTAMVRAVFDNPNQLLKPGQFVRVKILGLVQNDVLAIPQKAVMQSPTGATVYVVDDQNHAQNRPVILGRWIDDRWIIDQGLNVGDKVIVNRLIQLRPGVPVNARPMPPEEAVADATTPPTQPAN